MCQLVNRQAGIHSITRFSHNMANGIAIIGQHFLDCFEPEKRLCMAGRQHLWRECHQLVHGIGPDIEFTIDGPANGIKIWKRAIEIVTAEKNLLFRVPDNHMIRCFPWRHHKLQVNTGKGQLCPLFRDQTRRRQDTSAHTLQRTIPRANTNPDDFIRIGKSNAKLALCPRLHRLDRPRVQHLVNQRVV